MLSCVENDYFINIINIYDTGFFIGKVRLSLKYLLKLPTISLERIFYTKHTILAALDSRLGH